MIVLAHHGAGDALRLLVNKARGDDLVLRLYRNEQPPAAGAPAGEYLEADFPGYAPAVLDGRAWAVSDGPAAVAEYARVAFERSSDGPAQTVRGYYLTRARSGRVAWAEQLASPADLARAGDAVAVAPRVSYRAAA